MNHSYNHYDARGPKTLFTFIILTNEASRSLKPFVFHIRKKENHTDVGLEKHKTGVNNYCFKFSA